MAATPWPPLSNHTDYSDFGKDAPAMQPAHQQNRQHTRSPQSVANYQRAKRKKARRRRKATLVVAVVLLFGLLVTAFLVNWLSGRDAKAAASASTAAPVASAAANSAGPVTVSMPLLDLPAVANGPYDEAELPLLFNFDHAIPNEYTTALLNGGLADIGAGQQMGAGPAQAYLDMSAAAKADGVTLVPLSGYRSNQRQASNYNASIDRYLAQGYSHDEAVRRTEGYYAIPGTSEHEAGLAIDIGDAAAPGANIDDSFEKTAAFAWLQQHCTEYGFILRYMEEAFATTHIHYEPWHYRYVGANHAVAITQQGVTLEEYVQG